MISLNTKQKIILLWNEGRSKSEIARKVDRHRDTVRKYINEYENKKKALLNDNPGKEIPELIDDIVSPPEYDSSNRPKRKLTGDIMAQIKEYTNENKEKRQRGEGKQQKKKIDIFEALIDKGYDIGYTTVCNTVNRIEGTGAEAYIKAVYQPGNTCEFDWGEVKLQINGQYRKIQMAVFTPAYSNYRYAVMFMHQKTECFQEAHAKFFNSINSSYHQMVYDNMKVAVKRFTGHTEKEPTTGLLQLSMYYGFDFRFCNTRRGNEKGHVERSVEYVRRKAFCNRHTFDSLEEANNYLEQVCHKLNDKVQVLTGKTAYALFEEEKKYLKKGLPIFDAARTYDCKVDKYSCLVVEQNHYSVPEQFVGKIVFVKVYSTNVVCYYENEKIAVHERLYGNHEWKINIEHYLKTLKKKPGALPNSMAMAQAHQKIQNLYKKYYIKKEKDFIELMLLIQEKSLKDVEKAIEKLETIDFTEITTDKIKLLCNRQNSVTSSNNNLKQDETIVRYSAALLKSITSLIKQPLAKAAHETATCKEVGVL